MNGPKETCRSARPGAALLALGIASWAALPAPAAASVSPGASAAANTAQVTYTNRPAFTNATGQWRVAN